MDNKENSRVIIATKALSKGNHRYDFQLGKDFFTLFENTEVLDSDLHIAVEIEIAEERKWDISVKIEGYVVLLCDRCLEKFTMPVSYSQALDLEETEACQNDHTGQLDLTQYVYDNVCLAIPIQRVHNSEKDCDPDMLRIWKDNNIK